MIEKQSLIVAMRGGDSESEEVLGCVKVESNPDPLEESLGQWSMLCVDKRKQGKGIGSILRETAEKYLAHVGKTKIQIELLSPSNEQAKEKNVNKNRFREWVMRLGYDLKVPGDYFKSTNFYQPNDIVKGHFMFSTYLDATTYIRNLDAFPLENNSTEGGENLEATLDQTEIFKTN